MIVDYVGVKALDLLRSFALGVSATIYNDEEGLERLTESVLHNFKEARPDVTISVRRTKWIVDRHRP